MDIIGNIVFNSIMKVNIPEQTVSVIGEDGLICLYDIKLDR